jgi:hypothetical protein
LLVAGQIAEIASEIFGGGELLWVDVVEQTPQFASVILDGSTGEEKHSFAGHAFEGTEDFGVFVFEAMGFVDNDELEGNVHDDVCEVKQEDFVTGDQDLEFVKFTWNSGTSHRDVEVIPLIVLYATASRLPVLVIVKNAVHVGPLLHSALPVLQGGKGSNNEEGALDVFEGEQVVEEGDGLNSLAQSHLISQDGIALLVPGFDEPVETLRLVGTQNLIVFVDVWLIHLVLVGLLLGGHVVEVQSVLDFCNLSV